MIAGGVVALALATAAPGARANVFASNVKINGGMTNLAVAQGTNLSISYILNEPASAGVTIKVLAGATAVRTIAITNGPGTARGTNTVTWNGQNDSGVNVPGGNYSVSITAASTGYAGWTKTTDDNNVGNYVWDGFGIAVDRNTSSPYYGRVFVGNSSDNSTNSTSPYYGNYVGIQKLNADGSYADEGGFSTGGIAWIGYGYAPWRIRVSDDDQVYVQDDTLVGDIYRFDPTLSSNSMLHVFVPASDYTQGVWSGFRVIGKGTNTLLWASGYISYPNGDISRFPITTNGTFDASAGTNVVEVVGSPGLNGQLLYAIDVDKAGAIYTLNYMEDQGDSSALVLQFPPYDPSTNGGLPEYTANWSAGPGDDYAGGQGIAVNPTGTYVAACFWGYGPGPTDGNTKILNAATGTLVTNLDLGVGYTNNWMYEGDPFHHMDADADWDAVGNVYYLDDWGACWRAFSPPGANQATTVALPVVTIIAPETLIYITSIGVSNGLVTIAFTGGASDPPAIFALLSTPAANGTNWSATSAVITGSGGSFQATVPASGPRQFYRIQRLATVPIHISNLSVAAGVVTINFTGSSTDSASAFTLLSSGTASGGYSAAGGASITQLGPGQFQATVPVNGPRQFYQIRK